MLYSVLLGTAISNDIPYNDFYEYYAPDYKLHLSAATGVEDMNRPEQLQAIAARVLQNLRCLEAAPAVQMHPAPPDWVVDAASTCTHIPTVHSNTLQYTTDSTLHCCGVYLLMRMHLYDYYACC